MPTDVAGSAAVFRSGSKIGREAGARSLQGAASAVGAGLGGGDRAPPGRGARARSDPKPCMPRHDSELEGGRNGASSTIEQKFLKSTTGNVGTWAVFGLCWHCECGLCAKRMQPCPAKTLSVQPWRTFPSRLQWFRGEVIITNALDTAWVAHAARTFLPPVAAALEEIQCTVVYAIAGDPNIDLKRPCIVDSLQVRAGDSKMPPNGPHTVRQTTSKRQRNSGKPRRLIFRIMPTPFVLHIRHYAWVATVARGGARRVASTLVLLSFGSAVEGRETLSRLGRGRRRGRRFSRS